jgi:MFS family permease
VSQGTVIDEDTVRASRAAAIASVGLIALAVALGIGRFAFTPILPMMQQDVGLSVAAGGWLAAANYLGYLAGAVSAMALPVRPTTAIRCGLATIVTVTLGMSLADQFGAWVALRAIAGIGSAWVLVFASAWCLAGLAGVQRSLLSGVVFAGVGTGIAVAGGICLVLMQIRATSSQAWGALGVVGLAGSVAIWRTFGVGDDGTVNEPQQESAGTQWWSLATVRLVLCYGAFGFGYIIPATFLPVMARHVVRDPAVFGWSWPVFGIAAALSPLGAAAWARRIGIRRVWVASQLVMALGVGLPAVWPAIGGIIIAALLVGGTFMVITMAGMQEARVAAGPHARTLMAAMTSAFGAGQILGPVLVSSMIGGDESFSRPLLIACLLLVGSACALLAGHRHAPASST